MLFRQFWFFFEPSRQNPPITLGYRMKTFVISYDDFTEPECHVNNWVCLTHRKFITIKSKNTIKYLHLSESIKSYHIVPNCLKPEYYQKVNNLLIVKTITYLQKLTQFINLLFQEHTQSNIKDLVGYLNLSKKQTELLVVWTKELETELNLSPEK